jgi:hypothetical protein
MPDTSSPEFIAEGRRLRLSTTTWSQYKEAFISYWYNQRRHQEWTMEEWAVKAFEEVSKIDCSGYPDLDILKKRYLEELRRIQAGKHRSKHQEPITSFSWKSSEEQLKRLHRELQSGRYIQAAWKEFKPLFKAQPVSGINPIQWKATNWEIALLIDNLINKGLIERGNYNQQICHCFIDKNRNPYKPNSIKAQLSEAKKGGAGAQHKEESLIHIICLVASE